jgi:acetyl-CoA acetyltransferase
VAGVEPRIMGIGPAPASLKLLDKLGPQDSTWTSSKSTRPSPPGASRAARAWPPDDAEHVNPNGGAIALGHPLGMSGRTPRMTATEELHRRGGRYALCAMCIGVGQGMRWS